MKPHPLVTLLALSLILCIAAWANSFPYPGPPPVVDPTKYVTNSHQTCSSISGSLFTNIGFIPMPTPGGTNLGQAFGDLQGAVAATILGPDSRGGYDVQHYWVTTSGDNIYFKQGWLKPSSVTPYGKTAPASDLAAVLWGDYMVEWVGGTGRFANSTGYADTFGLADFTNLTLVLRYRGMICNPKHPGD